MHLRQTYVPLQWIALLLAVALVVASCGGDAAAPADEPEAPTAADVAAGDATSPAQTPTASEAATATEASDARRPTSDEPATTDSPVSAPTATQIPYDPNAVQVEMQLDRVEPVNAAEHMAFMPAQGGAADSGNCGMLLHSSPDATSLIFDTDTDTIDIGETATICYINFTPGPEEVEERVLDPNGEEIRSFSFTIDTDMEANSFTALPDDSPGIYTVVADTPEGTFETTFEVTDQIAIPGGRNHSQQRELKPIGHGPGYRSIEVMDYVFAYNFEPGETINLYFYEACNYSGIRRFSVIGRKRAAAGQAQVNAEGYAFIAIPQAIKESIHEDVYFVVLARSADTSPEELSPEEATRIEELWYSGNLGTINLGNPLDRELNRERTYFRGGENRFVLTNKWGASIPCSSVAPVEQAPEPPDAEPVILLETFDLDTETRVSPIYGSLTDLFTIEDGNIVQSERSFYALTKQSGQILNAMQAAGVSDLDQLPNRLVHTFTVDNTNYIALADGRLFEANLAAGEFTLAFVSPVGWNAWLFDLSEMLPTFVKPSVTVHDGMVVVGGEDMQVHAFDLETAAPLWTFPLEKGTSAPPLVVDDMVYVGSYEGYVYALDRASGTEQWRFAVGDWSNPPVMFDDTLYIMSENNYLYALDPESGAEQWRYTPTDDGTLASLPVVADDIVYIAVQQKEIGEWNESIWFLSVHALGNPADTEQVATFGEAPAAPEPPSAPPDDTTVSGGERPTSLDPARVSASSVYPPSVDSEGNPISYEPEFAVDGNPNTGWRVEGAGTDEFLLLEFDQPMQISTIQLIPGYAKVDPYDGTDRFYQNRRIVQARFEFSDGSSVEASFADRAELQDVAMEPVVSDFVRVVILDTIAPTDAVTFDSTAISEIVVLGMPAVSASEPPPDSSSDTASSSDGPPACVNGDSFITPGQTYRDAAENDLPAHADIIEVNSILDDETLTVILTLRDVPTELPYNELDDLKSEYAWRVYINTDADNNTGDQSDPPERGADYSIGAIQFANGAPAVGPIDSFDQTTVWKAKESGSYEASGTADLEADADANTITLSGTIPDIDERSRLLFQVEDRIEGGEDLVGCF
jgi:hypothetical protein